MNQETNNNEEASVWESLGYEKKTTESKLEQKLEDLVSDPKKVSEMEDQTADSSASKQRRLEEIFRIFPDSEFVQGVHITSQVGEYKFEFWPASDTWYSCSKQIYGHGIEKLLKLIEEKIINSGKHNA